MLRWHTAPIPRDNTKRTWPKFPHQFARNVKAGFILIEGCLSSMQFPISNNDIWLEFSTHLVHQIDARFKRVNVEAVILLEQIHHRKCNAFVDFIIDESRRQPPAFSIS